MPGTFSPPPRVRDPDMHQGTCVTHVPWWMPGPLNSGFLWIRFRGENVPGIPGACATCHFAYLIRSPCPWYLLLAHKSLHFRSSWSYGLQTIFIMKFLIHPINDIPRSKRKQYYTYLHNAEGWTYTRLRTHERHNIIHGRVNDDVIKWKRNRIHRSPGFPSQKANNVGFDVFFDVRLNGRINKHEIAGDLGRQDAHCDFIVMLWRVFCDYRINVIVRYQECSVLEYLNIETTP